MTFAVKMYFFLILIRRLQILCLLINIGIVCYVTYVYVDFYDLKIDFWIDYCRTLYSNLHKIWIRLIETWPCPVNEITGHSVAIVIAWRSIISITGWVIITNKTCWVYWWLKINPKWNKRTNIWKKTPKTIFCRSQPWKLLR